MMNHFKTLGVHRKTTAEELHERYKELAWKHHPDRKGGSHEKFAAIGEAYATLRSKLARGSYEEALALHCHRCTVCRGEGAKAKAKGLTARSYTACLPCAGSGYIIKRKK